jgi:dTDP-4-amino-4,6-dideoxygalactose transaminase
MEPYRSYYPHAGLVLPNTTAVAERVIVLPSGISTGEMDIQGIVAVLDAVAA